MDLDCCDNGLVVGTTPALSMDGVHPFKENIQCQLALCQRDLTAKNFQETGAILNLSEGLVKLPIQIIRDTR